MKADSKKSEKNGDLKKNFTLTVLYYQLKEPKKHAKIMKWNLQRSLKQHKRNDNELNKIIPKHIEQK